MMKIFNLFGLIENQDLSSDDLQTKLSVYLVEMKIEIEKRTDEKVKKSLKSELQELISKL